MNFAARRAVCLLTFQIATGLVPSAARAQTVAQRRARAEELAKKEDYKGAAEEYRKALQGSPQDEDLHVGLAKALQDAQQYAEALAEAREAHCLKPEDHRTHDLIVFCMAMTKAVTASETFRRELIGKHPNDHECRYMLARDLMEFGDPQHEALDLVREAVRLKPDKAKYQTFLDEIQKETQQDQAEEDAKLQKLREAARQDPDDLSTQRELGILLRKRGDLAGAAAAYREVVRIAPTVAQGRFEYGVVLAESGSLDEAGKELRESLSRGETAEAYFYLGKVLIAKKNNAAAASALREAIWRSPQNAEIHYALGGALVGLGDGAGARQSFSEAVRLAPSVGLYHHDLGYVLYYTGDKQGSLVEFQKAVELAPGNEGFKSDYEKVRGEVNGTK